MVRTFKHNYYGSKTTFPHLSHQWDFQNKAIRRQKLKMTKVNLNANSQGNQILLNMNSLILQILLLSRKVCHTTTLQLYVYVEWHSRHIHTSSCSSLMRALTVTDGLTGSGEGECRSGRRIICRTGVQITSCEGYQKKEKYCRSKEIIQRTDF